MANVGEMLVSNPCFQFQLIHNHATDLRRATNETGIILKDASRHMRCMPSRDLKKACVPISFILKKNEMLLQNQKKGGGKLLNMLVNPNKKKRKNASCDICGRDSL